MIIWDYSAIVAMAVTFILSVVIGLWVFYTFKRGPLDVPVDSEAFTECRFCGYLYFDYSKKEIGACPRCGSYQNVSSIQKA
jgi:hypothetical protein